MSASCNDGFFVGLFTDYAGKRHTLQNSFPVAVSLLLGFSAADACNYCAGNVAFSPGGILPFLIKLPTLSVVFPAMEVFAVVSKAAEACFFVLGKVNRSLEAKLRNTHIFANIGREIRCHRGADVGRLLHWPDGPC